MTPATEKSIFKSNFTVPEGSSYGEAIFLAKQLCCKVTSSLMFNPNLLCTRFWIKVWASKIAGCGFGGVGLNPPELWSGGTPVLFSGKFSEIRSISREGRKASRGNLASGCPGGGIQEAGVEDKLFFFFFFFSPLQRWKILERFQKTETSLLQLPPVPSPAAFSSSSSLFFFLLLLSVG